MKLIACLSLVFLASPARAADKDEEKAKEVTLAFLKAVKAKDLDAVMKTVDVPFFLGPGGDEELITKTDDLRAKLKAFIAGTTPDNVPDEVGVVLDMAAVRKKVDGAEKDKILERIDAIAGKTGVVVMFLKDGKPRGGLVVRLKDGQATVVGIPK